MAAVNALTAWLGIPAEELPTNFYRLLDLERFEEDSQAIRSGFERRRNQIEARLSCKSADVARRLLSKLELARQCLLDPVRKRQYDEQLRKALGLSLEELSSLSSDEEFPSVEEVAVTVSFEAPTKHETVERRQPQAGNATAPAITKNGIVSRVENGEALWSKARTLGSLACAVAIGAGVMWGLQALRSQPRPGTGVNHGQVPSFAGPPRHDSSLDKDGEPYRAGGTIETDPATEVKLDASPVTAQALNVEPPADDSAPPAAADTPGREPVITTIAIADSAVAAESVTAPAKDAATEPDEVSTFLASVAAPPPPPDCRSDGERNVYVGHVRSMLEAGLGKAIDRTKAKEHYNQAAQLCGTDPRLHYAYALIVHTSQSSEASQLLRLAMQQGAYAYPPAWRLWIDLEIKQADRLSSDKRLERSQSLVQRLPDFAERLETAAKPWPDDSARGEFAVYLGRVVGFWRGASTDSKKLADQITDADLAIQNALSETRRSVYEVAKSEVEAMYEDLRQQGYTAETKIAAKQKEIADRLEQVVEIKKLGLSDQEQKLVRSKEDYDKKWERIKEDFLRDWASIEAEGKAILDSINTTSAKVVYAQRQCDFLLAQIRQAAGPGQGKTIDAAAVTKANEATAQLGYWGPQRALFEGQVNQLQMQFTMAQAKARARLVQMGQTEADYQRATGQLVKESNVIAESRLRLDDQATRVAKQRAKRTNAKIEASELRRFSTYAPLDREVEKRRLLDSYSGL